MRLHRASILSGSIAPIIPSSHWAVGMLTLLSSLNVIPSSVTALLAAVPFLHMYSRTRTASSRPYTALCSVDRGNFAHFNASYKILNSFFVALSWKSYSFFWFDMALSKFLIQNQRKALKITDLALT